MVIANPLDVIEQYGNRIKLFHVKDMAAGAFPGRIEIVGDGIIDFPSIFEAAGGSTKYYVVEHDPRFGDPTFDPFAGRARRASTCTSARRSRCDGVYGGGLAPAASPLDPRAAAGGLVGPYRAGHDRGCFRVGRLHPPTSLDAAQFRLQPFGPQHNQADHAAWTSSIEHIRATPGSPTATGRRRRHNPPGEPRRPAPPRR